MRASAPPSLRPIHLRPLLILIVGVGGAFGTLARYLVGLVIPEALQLPWPTLTVNIVGALLLGVLLEGLSRRDRNEGRTRTLRLLLGTGFLGGFTTYSSLAVEAEQLLRVGRVWESIGYGVTTVIVGLFASLLGMWMAVLHHRSVARRSARAAAAAAPSGTGS